MSFNYVVKKNCRLYSRAGLVTGNNESISAEVTILTENPDMGYHNCKRRNGLI
jgi:hypothetical protein